MTLINQSLLRSIIAEALPDESPESREEIQQNIAKAFQNKRIDLVPRTIVRPLPLCYTGPGWIDQSKEDKA